MNYADVQDIEIEITADCNAQCPICARTRMGMKLTGNNKLSLDDIKHIFPNEESLQGKNVALCGTYGDPIVHQQCYEICEYLSNMGACVWLSTNGGYNSAEWWEKLALLKNVNVGFAVDGFRKTNHIYRVNVSFKLVERNMTAYMKAGGKGKWTYIVFEHNKDEVEEAEAFAKNLGLEFYVRGGGRNTVAIQHKPRKGDEVKLVTVFDTTKVKKHLDTIRNKDVIESKLDTIDCRHLNNKYIFIGSDMTLYPCCYLYAYSTSGGRDYIRRAPKDWNSLKTKTISEIMQHSKFSKIQKMWSPYHKRYVPKCFATCGNKGVYKDFDKKISNKGELKELSR